MDYQNSKALVEDLYETLLQRPAESAAIDDKAGRLSSGRASPRNIVDEIIHSDEFIGKIRSFVSKLRADHPFSINQSQYNEFDQLLAHVIAGAFDADARVVVDVGARGKERSNSYDLMRFFHWRGLLVEANPRLIPQIRREFAGLNAEIVESAVSDYDGTATLTIGVNDDVSSLNPSLAATWGDTRGAVTVSVSRLAGILQARHVPLRFGLLSIDIEGEDVKVLNDLIDTSLYRPRYIIIEASYDFATRSLSDLPTSDRVRATYKIIGQTSANLMLHLQE